MVHKQALFNGIVEVDESYFGSHRVPRKRGRGIVKQEGKVHLDRTQRFKKDL